MARGRSTYHHDDQVDSDQQVVNKELSLCALSVSARGGAVYGYLEQCISRAIFAPGKRLAVSFHVELIQFEPHYTCF
jgi:hypothetical protein